MRNAELENCRILELQDLRKAEFENCLIGEAQNLRKVEFEICRIWEKQNLKHVRMKTNPTFWEGCNFNQEGQFDLIETVSCRKKCNVPGNTQRVKYDRCTRLRSNWTAQVQMAPF